jgi:preprotein translocase subunit YajC
MFSTTTFNDICVHLVTVPFPGASPSSTSTTESGATPTGGEGQVATDPFGDGFMPMLMLLIVGMIVFSMFSGRKQKKKRAVMLDSLQKRDSVLTQGGVFGTIVEIKPDRVVLKVDESSNTRITVLRDSITQVTTETPAE